MKLIPNQVLAMPAGELAKYSSELLLQVKTDATKVDPVVKTIFQSI